MNLHASFAKVKLHHFVSKQIWFEYLLCIGVRMLLIASHFVAGMPVTGLSSCCFGVENGKTTSSQNHHGRRYDEILFFLDQIGIPIVLLIPCPIFNMQVGYSNKFIFVIRDNCGIMSQAYCSDHEIQWTNWRSFSFQISTNPSIAFCGFCVEVKNFKRNQKFI